MTDQQKALLAGTYALLELALPNNPMINPAMHLLAMVSQIEQDAMAKLPQEGEFIPFDQDDNCG